MFFVLGGRNLVFYLHSRDGAMKKEPKWDLGGVASAITRPGFEVWSYLWG